jgi:hypothetical protein
VRLFTRNGHDWTERFPLIFDALSALKVTTCLLDATLDVASSAAVAWPFEARAQQPGQLPIIGYMGQGTRAAEAKRVATFVERLRELSWIEGRTVVIEYRWTDGRSDLAADIAAEFARRKVDYCHLGNTANRRRNAGDRNDPDRVFSGGRSGRQRAGRESGATWRQCHRAVGSIH